MRERVERDVKDMFFLRTGHAYLIDDSDGSAMTAVLRDLHGKGMRILGFTRRHPSTFEEECGFGEGDLVWMTSGVGPMMMDSQNLGILTEKILKFFMGGEGRVVLLDGLEYLSVMNGFDVVLRFIYRLIELTILHHGILLLSVVPQTLEAKQYALLRREVFDSYPAGEAANGAGGYGAPSQDTEDEKGGVDVATR